MQTPARWPRSTIRLGAHAESRVVEREIPQTATMPEVVSTASAQANVVN
jgi:hypothetical protein